MLSKIEKNRVKIGWVIATSIFFAILHALLVYFDYYLFGFIECFSLECVGREHYYRIGISFIVVFYFVVGYAYPLKEVGRVMSALIFASASILCFWGSIGYEHYYRHQLYISTQEKMLP